MSTTDDTERTVPPPAPDDPPPPQNGEAASRLRVIWRRRRNLLLAFALLILSMSVVLGSLAVFTGESPNPTNVTSAGKLTITSDKTGVAIFTAAGMVPGESSSGTVKVKNTGTVAAQFRLDDSALVDTPGPNGGKLSTALDLSIVDLGPDGAPGGGDDVSPPVYTGKFDALPSIGLGTWAAAEAHAYKFTVTFRNTGLPGSPTTQDNAFKGSSVKVTYTWDATSQ
jgi:hypothetical protein